jgi:UDP-N-acetylmuramate--alanine ligase
LTLSPDFAVITSVDADHLDIYGNVETIEAGYRDFADRVKPGGILLVCDRSADRLGKACRTYGTGENADYRGTLHPAEGRNTITLTLTDGRSIDALPLPMPGQHNLENTLAAVSIAIELGITIDAIRSALNTFKGIKRRFEYQVNTGDTVFIDDYAHHPEELRATSEAVRSKHVGKRITGVFQPHLFSRTRDLAEGFATSLALLDEIILLDIYPAREEPLPGIDSQWLLDKIIHPHKKRVDKSQLLPTIREAKPEVLLTLGAGDIDREVEPIRRMLGEMQHD